MIQVTKTPLRISLAGGSTDLQEYLNKYGIGKVISFTPNLFTYIIMKESTDDYYNIVYSKIEKVKSTRYIKNDIAREVLTHFSMPPIEVIFTADIPSSGSGLASSTSYLINLIRACLQFKGVSMATSKIGELALQLERRFNPLTGFQDVYGCLTSGFKVMTFDTKGPQAITKLSLDLENAYDLHLVSTNSVRSSTTVLETLDYEKVHTMSALSIDMEEAIGRGDFTRVIDLVNIGWSQKKQTSPSILNKEVVELEMEFKKIANIKAWRLIGAGCGGYFLVIVTKDSYIPFKSIKIQVYDE